MENEQHPTWAEAAQARNEGIARSARNAERHTPGFAEQARTFILDYMDQHRRELGESLIDEAKKAGIKPHNDRGFGGVMKSLSHRGLLRVVGYTKRRKGHLAHGGAIWERTEKERPDAH